MHHKDSNVFQSTKFPIQFASPRTEDTACGKTLEYKSNVSAGRWYQLFLAPNKSLYWSVIKTGRQTFTIFWLRLGWILQVDANFFENAQFYLIPWPPVCWTLAVVERNWLSEAEGPNAFDRRFTVPGSSVEDIGMSALREKQRWKWGRRRLLLRHQTGDSGQLSRDDGLVAVWIAVIRTDKAGWMSIFCVQWTKKREERAKKKDRTRRSYKDLQKGNIISVIYVRPFLWKRLRYLNDDEQIALFWFERSLAD